jgi:ketosteroid isomerase-like protein
LVNPEPISAGEAVTIDTSIPDSELTHEQIIARNLAVVDAHFHNESPETVEHAIELYGENISWEAPTRGVVMKDPDSVLAAYREIFKTIRYRSTIPLRRFATEQFVFDDQIAHATVISDLMPNLPYPPGTDICARLAHVFEMKDGKIVREIAYEMWRKEGAPNAVDDIPEGATQIFFE